MIVVYLIYKTALINELSGLTERKPKWKKSYVYNGFTHDCRIISMCCS